MSKPMSRPELFAHPFSSYSQKALVALYENRTDFTYRNLEDAEASQTLAALWPIKRFPVLRDGDKVVLEASVIIEYLDLHHPGQTPLVPAEPELAWQVRMLDRFFDNYIATPQQKIVFDRLRPEDARDPHGVADARQMLDKAYAWLEAHMAGRSWAMGERFTLADCAAAPFLFYADWTHAIAPAFERVHAYRRRLLARPSFARAVEEARPFRGYFPLGAPDRD